MATDLGLPPGFVLDEPKATTPPPAPSTQQPQGALPPGFVVDQPTQDEPGLLSRIGEFAGEAAMNIPVGLGRLGVGAVQLGAELAGQEELSRRIGEQVQREREAEGEISTAAKVGRFVGETAPFLPVGAGLGAVRGGIAASGAIGALTPTEEGGIQERGEQVLTSGALGGVGGAAARGIGAVARQVGGAVKRLFTASKPEDVLARRLSPEQTSELLARLREAPADSPITIPDIAGDEVRGLTRAVGKFAGAKDIVTDALEGRSVAAVERVSNQLSKDISPVENYFASLDDLAKARSEIAGPIYQRAFAKDTRLNRAQNKELFEQLKPELREARNFFRISDDVPDNSIVMLDAAKKSLDDKIGAAIRGGENQRARALTDIKSQLVNKLDELNPDYKKARQVFSDFASIENAQQQGLQFNRLRPEELRRLFKKFPTSEKEAFRIGVRENLQKVVASTVEGADPAKRIFGNTFKRNQLRAIFDSDSKFKSFEKKMRDEIAAAETKFRVLGGSRTDINLATDAQFIDQIASGASIAGGNKAELVRSVTNAVKNRAAGLSEKNAKQLATILTDRTRGIEALERIAAAEKNEIQKRVISDFIRTLRPEVLATSAIIGE